MARYAILTDLNKCVGCLACSIACKVVNSVPVGSYWNKVLRIGPNPRTKGGQWPDVYTYFLTVQCQHCENPECVKVCPYSVRYLNEEEGVVEKCTLCEQKIAQGELPQCVSECGGRARFFGDLDQGLESFEAPGCDLQDPSYDAQAKARMKWGDLIGDSCDYPVKPYDENEVYHLPDVGNAPSFVYILRNEKWQGGGE